MTEEPDFRGPDGLGADWCDEDEPIPTPLSNYYVNPPEGNQMPQITRRLEFDYGHRILRHESACKHLHGHRGVADITITAPGLDSEGRVVDFGVIKGEIGAWIDENWDHNMLLNEHDPLLKVWQALYGLNTGDEKQTHEWRREVFGGKDPYVMPDGLNPTAEVMANHLLFIAQDIFNLKHNHLRVTHVRMFETPNCSADAYAPAPLLP